MTSADFAAFDDPFAAVTDKPKRSKKPSSSEEKKKSSGSRKSRDGSNDTATTKSSSASHSGDEKPKRRKERPEGSKPSSSSRSKSDAHALEHSFDGMSLDSNEDQPRPQRSRRRASCIGGPVSASSMSMDSHVSGDGHHSRAPSQERAPAATDPAKPTRRRAGRRASTIGGAAVDSRVNSDPAPELDYGYQRSHSADFGYGSGTPDSHGYGYGDHSNDMGYGDAAPTVSEQPKPSIRRAGRRASVGMLLDDFKSGGADIPAAASTKRDLSGPTMQQNIMVPMAGAEKPNRRGRRASLIGAVGGAVGAVSGGVVGAVGTVGGGVAGAIGFGGKKEDEALDEKKARRAGLTRANSKDNVLSGGFDRDRRRTGTLAASSKDRTASARAGGSSYSDRMAGRR